MSYKAIVAKVNCKPHPNADNLQLADVNGYQVIIGKDVADQTLGVFFPPDGQLSEAFAEANDLVGYTDPNTGEKKGGYFAKNRRVRAQRLRGEKSDGYWTEFSSFNFTGFDMSQLSVGDTFDTLNGIEICNKYFTPATLKQMANKAKVTRKNKCFPKHIETEKLQYEIDNIEPGSIIYITEKLHGTSARYAYVLDEKDADRKWYHKLIGRKPKIVTDWDFLIGTRNMILGKSDVPSYYGSEEFRYTVGNKLKDINGNISLHKGEIVYGEIVGYTHTGAAIMGEHDTSKLKDIKKKYGKSIVYKYGNIPGNFEFYVYRIAHVNEDGEYIDLPWPQVKKRCRELGINYVPEVQSAFIYTATLGPNGLMAFVDGFMEGSSLLDESHIREGVVLRVESPSGNINYYKSKSFTFGVLEGYIKDREDYVDLEEVA